MATKVGLEPTTFRLEVCCATIAPLGLSNSFQLHLDNIVGNLKNILYLKIEVIYERSYYID
ncbi:hypothetical protein TTHERM_00418400 (macronuclear) [Tetrahymena thermophila SB210]|uniref:Uncharacterized protein n=1 Tax=Tetrahymena thermophila (strain SB210) TaxID=312017 RepID=Q22NV6_TETTS|nr:hypothetical protein TTHERM_00418400 [Tetrahymena thermophila SB210]EAR87055.1 hypothetical protein TTHERM_00418400 [Tetrahymena thermophila SB210]|eukprot:XP_001007300.1 hypothetical protein TTHERM_00418400 [Tetrahymena thermophila SB210]